MKTIILLAILGLAIACKDNADALVTTGERDDINSINTPPIKRMKVKGGGYVYLFEDTEAMDSYTDAEKEELDSLF